MKNQIPWRQLLSIVLLVALSPFIAGCEKDIFDNDHGEGGGSGPGHTSRTSSAVATDWYALQLKMIIKANPTINPILLSRAWGYVGIGLYESVRPGIKRSVSLSRKLYQMPPMPQNENDRYAWDLAANAAMKKLVTYFYPMAVVSANQQSIDSLESVHNEAIRPTVTTEVFSRSQSFGNAIADAVIAWSQTDNSNLSNTGYTPPVFPGAWEPTPPSLAGPLCPYFGNTRPFLKENLNKVVPPFKHAYSEDPGSDFYKMEQAMCEMSQTLTQEQKNIAFYWNDVGVGVGYTPPGHSVAILTQILRERKFDLGKAAIAYAKTGIALNDAAIVGFRSKYKYNMLRPVTYIKKVIDPSWTPLIGTPPHPEYPAAHAFLTQAFMKTMTGIFGENFSFTDKTHGSKYGGPRTFTSFNAAAEECGMSRNYGGIHYLPSIQAGIQLGKQVGQGVNSLELVHR